MTYASISKVVRTTTFTPARSSSSVIARVAAVPSVGHADVHEHDVGAR